MKINLISFGEISIDGHIFNHDVIIEKGEVAKRNKKASRPHQAQYGHTPLSAEEHIPWGGEQLIIGIGLYGRLPVMPQVMAEARQRGVEVIALPTREACNMLSKMKPEKVNAILHLTC